MPTQNPYSVKSFTFVVIVAMWVSVHVESVVNVELDTFSDFLRLRLTLLCSGLLFLLDGCTLPNTHFSIVKSN